MKTTFLTILLPIVLVVGCGKKPEPLRIACSDDLLPVVKALGREFRQNFGIPVITTVDVPDEFASGRSSGNFDFIITDDLDTVARLQENGTILRTMDVACVMPVLVLRRDDHLPVLKLTDLATVDLATLDRPLRMTVASPGATLLQMVRSRFEQADIPFEGDDAKIQWVPFLVKEMRSDGTQRLTTADVTLQQLRDGETDIVVFWDFVAAATMMKQDDANDFVTVAWPAESSDTITIPLGMVRDCTDATRCGVFMDFVKSRRGTELLNSCFLHPSDDLVGTQQLVGTQ